MESRHVEFVTLSRVMLPVKFVAFLGDSVVQVASRVLRYNRDAENESTRDI